MMLKAMINHRLRRCTVFLCTFLLVSYAGFSAAAPPEFAGDKGFPQYVEGEFALVKQMLEANAEKLDRNAGKMDALSTQLSGVEANLIAEIVAAKEEINARVDLLAEDVDEVLVILNSPDKDIELTTEVCFDLGASWDWAYTGKLAGGLGIELGLSLEAQAELSMPGLVPISPLPYVPWVPIVPAVSAGVSDTICITVPLYAIASNDHWIENFDTSEFDALLASVAQPAQFLLPGLAHAYGQVMPTPEEAIGFVTDGLGLFDPSKANVSVMALSSNGLKAEKTVFLSNGMQVSQAALNAVSASHDNMMLGSPLLQSMLETNSIGEAVSDPCSFAASFGLPGADVLAAQCGSSVDMFWDIVDPLCLVDILVDHCP